MSFLRDPGALERRAQALSIVRSYRLAGLVSVALLAACFTDPGVVTGEGASLGSSTTGGGASSTTQPSTGSTTGASSTTGTASGGGETDDPANACGDGELDPGEESVSPSCGDGVVHLGAEECDDGNSNDGDERSKSCTKAERGGGVLQATLA